MSQQIQNPIPPVDDPDMVVSVEAATATVRDTLLAGSDPGIVAITVLWCVRLLTAFVVLCTLLPFIRSGWWVIRACDFPRLQLAIMCLLMLLVVAGVAWRFGWKFESSVITTLLVIGLVWQAWHVVKYTPVWATTVPSSDNSQLRLLVTNLNFENDQYASVAEAIKRVDPDVLLLIEIDEQWHSELAHLRDGFEHRTEENRGEGLGIALWSKVPAVDGRVEYLISDDRPSTWATTSVDDVPAHFVGVHPTPPGLAKRDSDGRHDSRIRDAELVVIARDVAADGDAAWIVAGDFNDVAWSHTTRLFQRLSGLRDPRVGRGMYSTYHAQYPLLRYPLDHVFVSEGIRVARLDRITIPGSDHFAMLAEFDLSDAGTGVEPDADAEDRREAAEMVDEGTEDATDSENLPP